MNMRDTVMVVGGRCHPIALVAVRGAGMEGLWDGDEDWGGSWG